MSKNPDYTSTIYLGSDGRWHGRVTMGYRDDGSKDRRHVASKGKAEVVKREACDSASGAPHDPHRAR